jgi:thymidylate kinase
MKVLFEGVEGVGKTTTITKLAEKLENEGYNVRVFKQPKPEYIELYKKYKNTPFYFCPFLQSLIDDYYSCYSNSINIFDRGLLSNWIYNFPTLNKYFIKFTKQLFNFDLVFILTANLKDILERTKERQREWNAFDKTLIKKRNNLFFKLAQKHFKNNFYYFNSSINSVDEITTNIKNIIIEKYNEIQKLQNTPLR